LAGSREGGALLMADANPFDLAATNGVCKRIEGVADEAEYLLDANLVEHLDQNVGYGLRHLVFLALSAFAGLSSEAGH
jgi:hypothetical protein